MTMESVFYSTKRKQNERKVSIFAPQGLTSRPPAKEKRIRIRFVMPLSGVKTAGTPEWISHAHTFVGQSHKEVDCKDVQFTGCELVFSVDNLFGEKLLTISGAQLKKFRVYEMGSSESPDVVMSFVGYLPYSKKAWEWLGQYMGEEIWTKFTIIQEPEEEEDAEEEESEDQSEFELTGEDEETEDEDELPEIDEDEEEVEEEPLA